MKQITKVILIVLAALMAGMSARSQLPGELFESGGIQFRVWNANEKTVSVAPSNNRYRDMRDVVIPEEVSYKGVTFTVTQIEDKAFYQTPLTSVVIPGTVKKIGLSAFERSENLYKVTLGEGVEFIDNYAFYKTGLTEINFPESLKVVEMRICDATPWYSNQPYGEIYCGKTFYGYKSDYDHPMPENTRVFIKEGTKVICGGALSYNRNLIIVRMPKSVISLGEQAFRECPNLHTLELSSNIAYCGLGTFWGCPAVELEEMEYIGKVYYKCYKNYSYTAIREGTTMIAPQAFKEKSSYMQIDIPSSVKYIGNEAFMNCGGLKSLILPDSLRVINERAFFSCYSVDSVKLPAQLECIEYLGLVSPKVKYLQIPANLNFNPDGELRKMCKQRYYVHKDHKLLSTIDGVLTSADKKKIISYPKERKTKYRIPDGVTAIGEKAFELSQVTDVVIPKSVAEIGAQAFSCCDYLENVTFEDSSALTELQYQVFGQSQALKSIKIPSSVRKIGPSAFYYCRQLEKIDFPPKLEAVGMGALDNTAWLDAQPDGVVYVRNFAYDLKGTPDADLVLRDDTKAVCGYFGRGVKELKSVTLPASLESVGKYAFEESGIEKISGGEKSIMDFGAFHATPWFYNFPERIVHYGISTLGNNHHYDTGDEIVINEGIEVINYTCFLVDRWGMHYDLGLRKIELPRSTKYIASGAMANSLHVEQLFIKASTPPKFLSETDQLTEWDTYSDCTLIVPPGSVEAYQNHPIWGIFRTIIADPTAVEQVMATEEEDANAPMFNIMGQRINQPYSGQIYIQNGKKKIWRN